MKKIFVCALALFAMANTTEASAKMDTNFFHVNPPVIEHVVSFDVDFRESIEKEICKTMAEINKENIKSIEEAIKNQNEKNISFLTSFKKKVMIRA